MNRNITSSDYPLSVSTKYMVLIAAFGLVILMPHAASAGLLVGNALCNAFVLAQGSAGRGIATLGVIIIGISALLGRISFGTAVIVMVGIAGFLSANVIAQTIFPGAGCGY